VTATVLPTDGCRCATCEYLRRTEVKPAPDPFPWRLVPQAPPVTEQGWMCRCGARVYSMQVHHCPLGGVTFGTFDQ
jgi:hypothetical protein